MIGKAPWGGGEEGVFGGRWVPRGCFVGVCIRGFASDCAGPGWPQTKVVLESNTEETERACANGYKHQKLLCCSYILSNDLV